MKNPNDPFDEDRQNGGVVYLCKRPAILLMCLSFALTTPADTVSGSVNGFGGIFKAGVPCEKETVFGELNHGLSVVCLNAKHPKGVKLVLARSTPLQIFNTTVGLDSVKVINLRTGVFIGQKRGGNKPMYGVSSTPTVNVQPNTLVSTLAPRGKNFPLAQAHSASSTASDFFIESSCPSHIANFIQSLVSSNRFPNFIHRLYSKKMTPQPTSRVVNQGASKFICLVALPTKEKGII